MHFIGIEIGGTKLQLAVGNERGEILDRVRSSVDRAAGGAAIREQIARTLPPLLDRWKPAAIGTGFGGPVDWRAGRIKCSHHVAGWEDFPLAEWLATQTGLPSFIENDANAAAFAEAHLGAGRDASTVFWINSGTGVGGALIIDGRIYHGRPPGEMEVGHLRVIRSDGTECILEEMCAGPHVDDFTRGIAMNDPASPLARLIPQDTRGGETKFVAPAFAQGCKLAAEVISDTAKWIAHGLGPVVNLLNPDVIVFGGGLSLIGEPLRAEIERQLPGNIMQIMLPPPPVRLSALREDAVPAGALLIAAHRLAEATH